ncbi:hypothetical protein Gotri_027286 [Gossypium trilobum]|uniref:Uncharacterized protein n=1 Tax=Gossypium trilobum TaxID=34281 RepID=A0A7J9FQ70_9ROSI|nr:hypothetical protein [Gossypium trilobum]
MCRPKLRYTRANPLSQSSLNISRPVPQHQLTSKPDQALTPEILILLSLILMKWLKKKKQRRNCQNN